MILLEGASPWPSVTFLIASSDLGMSPPGVSLSPDGGAQAVEPFADVLLTARHQQEFGFGEAQL